MEICWNYMNIQYKDTKAHNTGFENRFYITCSNNNSSDINTYLFSAISLKQLNPLAPATL